MMGINFSFPYGPYGGFETIKSMERLEWVVLTDHMDVCVWKLDKDGVFSVTSCYLLLQNLWPFENVFNGVE